MLLQKPSLFHSRWKTPFDQCRCVTRAARMFVSCFVFMQTKSRRSCASRNRWEQRNERRRRGRKKKVKGGSAWNMNLLLFKYKNIFQSIRWGNSECRGNDHEWMQKKVSYKWFSFWNHFLLEGASTPEPWWVNMQWDVRMLREGICPTNVLRCGPGE